MYHPVLWLMRLLTPRRYSQRLLDQPTDYPYIPPEEIKAAQDQQDAVDRAARETHQDGELCLYQDIYTFHDGFCPAHADGADGLCEEHRRKKCQVCGQQAVCTQWVFGSVREGHDVCEKHKHHHF